MLQFEIRYVDWRGRDAVSVIEAYTADLAVARLKRFTPGITGAIPKLLKPN